MLWDLEPQTDASVRAALHPGSEPIVIRFSGLDRSWSTTELRGETLLSEPVTAPAAVLEDPDARTVAPDLAGEAPPAAVSGGTAPILPAAPAEGESFA